MAQNRSGKHAKQNAASQGASASPAPMGGNQGVPGNPRAAHPQPTAPQPTAAMPPVPPVAQGAAGGYVPTFQVNTVPPEGKKHRGLKIFGITVASLLGLVALVYLAGVFIFMGRFFPHTTIIGMDISGKTPEEVHQMLDGVLSDYTFKVEGHGLDLTLSAKDMGMSLDSKSIADGLLSEMNPWAWPYEVFQSHDDTDDLVSTFEETKLAETIQAAVDAVNAKGDAPKDASLAYDESVSAYKIIPEEEGNTLLADVVLDQVVKGTVNFAPKVKLTDAVLARPAITEDDPDLAAAREEANKYLEGTLELTMAGEVVAAVDTALLADHIKIGKNLKVTLNAEPIVEQIKDQVNNMDTTGAKRTYTRPDGKEYTVEGGDYGWITDSQATADKVQEALEAGKGGTIEIIMKQNAAQAPDENGRDFGNRFIDVDLKKQVARLYDEDGKVIWKSDIVSGLPKDGRDTPTGTYYIKTNDGASTLRGYKPDGSKDYETKVDYWMPFKDNSVGFHDASWQPEFGGKRYKTNGSHGCINLPPDKAKELHELIKVGDPVVVHN
ncbi:L,D-transpeptidase family protein [uncultured Adlercreutzia sp.]|uniref:L,D-transpeptidase family protein n=1 Tax=uncultured Adlercreutzia sp. TaxID=875803 RepID=UPI0025E24497|nr:L,D-transpeptidase family protein [uncultured Adlercreutzia sp.]MCI9262668.1 L,D-transpeptidase family protein [Eggerthellaceae bacterium]